MIVGIDEVGRGSWAGPLVVGAVVMGGETIDGLTDSKKLTAKKREILSLQIKQTAAGIGIGWVSAKTVDQIGISRSLTLATQRALAGVNCEYDQIIIDGTVNFIDDPRVTTMKQADLLVPSVSAASIIAKVARDHYMTTIAHVFPDYGFERHVGYGTAAHQAALGLLGASPIHRMSFAPMKGSAPIVARPAPASTAGQLAEQAAADHLIQSGFRVLERNWKTKWCEIDIVAERDGQIHFVEVKYRKNDQQGDGLAYITPKKQRQMKFAAELWLQSKPGYNSTVLSAMSLSGMPILVEKFIERI
jgi:ribonuclease HII